MTKQENLVKVYDDSLKEVLFECPITQIERAYRFLSQMEELNIPVRLSYPSLPETLNASLGHSQELLEQLKTEITEEIESHNEASYYLEQALQQTKDKILFH